MIRHDDFQTHLFKTGKTALAACVRCNLKVEDVTLTLLICPALQGARKTAKRKVAVKMARDCNSRGNVLLEMPKGSLLQLVDFT